VMIFLCSFLYFIVSFLIGCHILTKPIATMISSQQPIRMIQLGWKPFRISLRGILADFAECTKIFTSTMLVLQPSSRYKNISYSQLLNLPMAKRVLFLS
jgi:hypothetical protein